MHKRRTWYSALSLLLCVSFVFTPQLGLAQSIETLDDGFGGTGKAQPVNTNPWVAPLDFSPAAPATRERPSPFARACLDPATRAGVPPLGLRDRRIPLFSPNGRSARQFLNKLASMVAMKISLNAEVAEGFAECLVPNPDGSEDPKLGCAYLRKFADDELPKLAYKARRHLSAAQTEFELRSWAKSPKTEINAELNPLGTYKYNRWKPLDEAELLASTAHLNEYRRLIEVEIQNKVASGELPPSRSWYVGGKEQFFDAPETMSFRNQALYSTRMREADFYREIISSVPILQYFENAHPSRASVLSAAMEMSALLKEEKAQLAKTYAAIHRIDLAAADYENYRKTGSLDADALRILDYRELMEIALKADPADCEIATMLLETRGNRELGNMLAIGLPVLAAGIVLSPLLSIPIGIAAGVGFTAESRHDLKHAERQYLSQVIGNQVAGYLETVEAADRNYSFNVWTLPVAFVGSQILARQVTLRLSAVLTGTKVVRDVARMQAGLQSSAQSLKTITDRLNQAVAARRKAKAATAAAN